MIKTRTAITVKIKRIKIGELIFEDVSISGQLFPGTSFFKRQRKCSFGAISPRKIFPNLVT